MQVQNREPAPITLPKLPAGATLIAHAGDADAIRERAAALLAEAKGIAAAAEGAGREMTTAEADQAHALLDRVEALAAEHGLEIRNGELIAPGSGRKTTPGGNESRRVPADAARAFGGHGIIGGNYEAIFGRKPSAMGFESFGAFAHAVAHRDMNQLKSIVNAGSSVGDGASGGFFTPTQFVADLMTGVMEQSILMPRVRVIPLYTMTATVPVFNRQNRSTGLSGFSIQWLGEKGALTKQTAKARLINAEAKKAAIYTAVSTELVMDGGTAFTRELYAGMTDATTMGFDDVFINGNGAGKPLGILAASSTVSVAKESGQAASTIVGANLLKQLGRLMPESFNRAIYLVHPSTLPQLLAVHIDFDTAGAAMTGSDFRPTNYKPFLQEPGGRFSLFGRPVFVTDLCQPVGTQGDIILVDPTQYLCFLREEARFDTSSAPDWETDEQSFRLIWRLDGMPLLDSAVTPKNGADTLSWAVVIDTRS